MTKSYLVTGAGGMLGRRFVQVICKRNIDDVTHIRLLDIFFSDDVKDEQRQSCEAARIEVEWIVADITNYAELSQHVAGMEVVIHMASIVDFLELVSFEKMWTTNVGGTRNIISACLQHSVKGLVYTSSIQAKCCNIYRDGFDGDEDTPYLVKPVNTYGKTKVAAEKLVLEANSPGSFHTCALRPSGLYGYVDYIMKVKIDNLPENKVLVNVCDCSYLQTRMDVDNAAWCHVLAAKQVQVNGDLVGGNAFFIRDDTPDMSATKFTETVNKPRGYTMTKWHIPYMVLYFIGWICLFVNKYFQVVGSKKKIHISPSAAKLVCVRCTTSDKKFREYFGYTPIYSWPESLRKLRKNIGQYLETKE